LIDAHIPAIRKWAATNVPIELLNHPR
jgi:hypothetical protein